MDTAAQASIIITARPQQVWEALTNPKLVKQYMFGVNLVTSWKVGEPVLYRGEWEGQPYEDKGIVLVFEPTNKLVMTYFSPLSGKADKPENYMKITYELESEGNTTTLRVTQENNTDAEAAKKSAGNWRMILQSIKTMLEK